MNRKEIKEDGTRHYLPTKTILVIFRASVLPQYISINHVRIPVEPYEQNVLLCYNCFRYGHLHKQCKGNIRCLNCQKQHNINECENPKIPKCFYCDGEHFTNEIKKCPEFNRQKSVKKLMTDQNMSYSEAIKQTPKVAYATVVSNGQISNVTHPAPTSSPYQNSINSGSQMNLTTNTYYNSLHNNHSQQPRYVNHSKQPSKRPRTNYTQDNTASTHKSITKTINIPSSSVLDNVNYQKNIRSLDQSGHNNINVSPHVLVSLIISVVNELKQQKTFDIQESMLHNIIQNNLVNNSSDDELF